MSDLYSQLPEGWTAPTLNGEGNGPYRLLHGVQAGLVGRFNDSCKQVKRAQDDALARVLDSASGTDFAMRHGLSDRMDRDAFRAAIPLAGFEPRRADLDRVYQGEALVLTRHLILSFVKSSGTTGHPKRLPVTAPWEREVSDAQALWVLAMLQEQESVSTGRALSSVGSAREHRSPAGLWVGANTGRMFLKQPWWVRRRYAVPYEVFLISDVALRSYCILRIALSQDVRTWTTANPSTLLALARSFERYREPLTRDLANRTFKEGPAASLSAYQRCRWGWSLKRRHLPEKGGLAQMWSLASINCWKGGAAPFFIDRFSAALGVDVRVREVGISASEGYFAIPLHSSWTGGVAWACGHLMEFVSQRGEVYWLDELELGESYRLIISTTAGLYRYDLNDWVKVVGFYGKLPVLHFVGKGEDVLSVTGEKVTAQQVSEAVRVHVEGEPRGFSVGIILEEVPRYCLCLEGGRLDPVALDCTLASLNEEYESKRDSGRLGPMRVCYVPDGTYGRFRAARLKQGAADGQVKDPVVVQSEVLLRLMKGYRG